MVLTATNRAKQLLYVSYIGKVGPEELVQSRTELDSLITGLAAGFRLLVDLSALESMGLDCAPEIGRTMECIDQSGVGVIVRVIPDPEKDIGFNIFSIFHYPHHPRILTCASMSEAGRHLEI
jgi:hypothetical protein